MEIPMRLRTIDPFVIVPTLIIVLELFIVAYAYTSSNVARGHRLYALKRGAEDWQVIHTPGRVSRVKQQLSLTERRLKEAQKLIHTDRENFSFGYLIEIVKGATEIGPDTHLTETLEEAVETIQTALKEANTILDPPSYKEAVEAIETVTDDQTKALKDLAQEVGITDPVTMGSIASGIQAFEKIHEDAAEVLTEVSTSIEAGNLSIEPSERLKTNVEQSTPDYDQVDQRIEAQKEKRETLEETLTAQLTDATSVERIAQRIEALSLEATAQLTEGRTDEALEFVKKAEALSEEAVHFVSSPSTEVQDTRKEEKTDPLKELEFTARQAALAAEQELKRTEAQYERLADQKKSLRSLLSSKETNNVSIEQQKALNWIEQSHQAWDTQDWERAAQNAREAQQAMTRALNVYAIRASDTMTAHREGADVNRQAATGDEKKYATSSSTARWVSVEEWFDGHDKELLIKNEEGQPIERLTNNATDDRSANLSGDWIVWQTLTSNGWEIMKQERNKKPIAITKDTADDTQPKTDGRIVMWQKAIGQETQILLSFLTSTSTTQISTPGRTTRKHRFEGGTVFWEEWEENVWKSFSKNTSDLFIP